MVGKCTIPWIMPLLEEYETVRREGPENICLTKGEGHVLVIDDEEPLLRLAKAIRGRATRHTEGGGSLYG